MEKKLLRDLKGVGEKTEKLFLKLNLRTTEDLLTYYPHRYDTYEPAVSVREGTGGGRSAQPGRGPNQGS